MVFLKKVSTPIFLLAMLYSHSCYASAFAINKLSYNRSIFNDVHTLNSYMIETGIIVGRSRAFRKPNIDSVGFTLKGLYYDFDEDHDLIIPCYEFKVSLAWYLSLGRNAFIKADLLEFGLEKSRAGNIVFDISTSIGLHKSLLDNKNNSEGLYIGLELRNLFDSYYRKRDSDIDNQLFISVGILHI